MASEPLRLVRYESYDALPETEEETFGLWVVLVPVVVSLLAVLGLVHLAAALLGATTWL